MTNIELLEMEGENLFSEEQLNEVYTGKRYSKESLAKDLGVFLSKSSSKGNPFRDEMKKHKGAATTTNRDLASEVKGLSNAREILALAADFRQYKTEMDKLAMAFDQWKAEVKSKVTKLRDDDKAGHKAIPKEVKAKLNKFNSQLKHYSKLLPKATAKALKVQPMITQAQGKKDVANAHLSSKADKVTKKTVAGIEKETAKMKEEAKQKRAANKIAKQKAAEAAEKKAKTDAFKNKVKAKVAKINFKQM